MIRLAATLLAVPLALAGPSWLPSAHTSVTWQDNATNADRASDILDAAQILGEFAVTRRTQLARDDAFFTSLALTAESWPRFDGLDRAGAGVRLAWQHKFGLGPFAPLLALEGVGDFVTARESGRAGRNGLLVLTARQRLSQAWRVRGRHEEARYDGRAHAFDRTGRESTLGFEFEAAPGWRLSASGSRRHGGVLSYATPPRPDLLREGKALTTVTTFDRSIPMVAYYFIARTDSWRVESAHSLGATRTLSLAAEYRDTARGPVRYVNRLITLGVSQRF